MSQSQDTQPDKPAGNSRRKWYLLGLALIFILAGAAWLAYYLLVGQFYAQTDDAYVQGNRVQLSPQISGTVTAIAAEDTDHVAAGQTVVRLDDATERVALDRAEAGLAQTVRSVRRLFARVDEQHSIIEQRRSTTDQAHRDYLRDQRLVDAHGVTRQAFEQARARWQADKAGLAAARHKLSELKAQTENTTVRTHPEVRSAEAEVRRAYLALQRTHVIAPVGGTIAQRDVQVGQEVSPDQPMLSIVPQAPVWVDANFKETALASMRIGQPATVVSDFYGNNVVYHGHVAGIAAGTGSAFELLPPQNATGNWIKIVRRVPVRIVIDNKDHRQLARHPLRVGLSTEVTVNLHDTHGAMLSSQPPAKPRYTTNVYGRRLAGADALIRRIVNANAGKDADTASPNAS